jgi:hypothetical protein
MWVGIALTAAFRGLFMVIWYTLYERRIPLENEARAFAAIGEN